MKTIDWNRPYGEICGSFSIPGARYTQDGLYFNPKGQEVGVTVLKPAEPVVVPAKVEEVKKAEDTELPPAVDNLILQCQDLKAQGLTDTEIGERLGITRQKVTKILC